MVLRTPKKLWVHCKRDKPRMHNIGYNKIYGYTTRLFTALELPSMTGVHSQSKPQPYSGLIN